MKAYFDVGNVVFYGFPQDWIRTLGKRIVRVHLKDFKLDRGAGRFQWKNLGEGDIDWVEVRKALTEIGYDGYMTIEIAGGDAAYHKDVSARIDRFLAGSEAGRISARLSVLKSWSQPKIIRAISTASTANVIFTQLYGYLPAIWPVDAVDDHLIRLRAVVVGEQPDRHEDVLEGLRRIVGVDLQVALRVARHLLRAQRRATLRVHRPARVLRGGDQIDLILLDHPARHVAGVVRHQRDRSGNGSTLRSSFASTPFVAGTSSSSKK